MITIVKTPPTKTATDSKSPLPNQNFITQLQEQQYNDDPNDDKISSSKQQPPFQKNNNNLKFFIIAPPKYTTDLIHENPYVSSLYYDNAINENSGEVWLHRSFEQLTYEQGHTTNPYEADVFLICGYFHFYHELPRLTQQERSRSNRDYTEDFRNLLVNRNKPHLLLIPTVGSMVERTPEFKIVIDELVSNLLKNKVNLWSVGYERNSNWQLIQPDRIIPIPYVLRPTATKNDGSKTKITMPNKKHHKWKNSIFYYGDRRPHAKDWGGCDREKLLLQFKNNTKQQHHHHHQQQQYTIDIQLVDTKKRLNQIQYNDRMVHSEYCLIVCGDTPTSRSLTSAMANGCIPIRIGSRLRGLCEYPPCHLNDGIWQAWEITGEEYPHLPFINRIPWNLFPEVDEMKFSTNGLNALQDLLFEMNTKDHSNSSRKYRLQRIMDNMKGAWTYGWGNPTNSTDFGDAALFIWDSFVSTLQQSNQ